MEGLPPVDPLNSHISENGRYLQIDDQWFRLSSPWDVTTRVAIEYDPELETTTRIVVKDGYTLWLPDGEKYIVNNTTVTLTLPKFMWATISKFANDLRNTGVIVLKEGQMDSIDRWVRVRHEGPFDDDTMGVIDLLNLTSDIDVMVVPVYENEPNFREAEYLY